MQVEVFPVRDGRAFVDVPIMLHGAFVHCAFFADNSSVRLVRIFGGKSSQGRKVPASVIREARQRAFDAVADLAPQTERMTCFAFAADVAR